MERRHAEKDLPDPAVVVVHNGSELSYQVTAAEDAMSLEIIFADGAKKIIKIEGYSPVSMFCPSIEGTVILCYLESGEEQFYDTLSGSLLSLENMNERSGQGQIHFYN